MSENVCFVLLAVDFSAPASAMLRRICHWNQRQLLLHPRTCLEIRKLIRKEVPDEVDVIPVRASESCHTCNGERDQPAVQHRNTVQMVYSEVSDAGFLGRTLAELQVCRCTNTVNVTYTLTEPYVCSLLHCIAKSVMFSICVFVCLLDNWKSGRRILTKVFGGAGYETSNS